MPRIAACYDKVQACYDKRNTCYDKYVTMLVRLSNQRRKDDHRRSNLSCPTGAVIIDEETLCASIQESARKMPSKTDPETRNASMSPTCKSTENRRNAIVTESPEATLPYDQGRRREDRRARQSLHRSIGFDAFAERVQQIPSQDLNRAHISRSYFAARSLHKITTRPLCSLNSANTGNSSPLK